MQEKIKKLTMILSMDTPVVISPDGEGMPGCVLGIRNKNKTIWKHSKMDLPSLTRTLFILKKVRDKKSIDNSVASFSFDPSSQKPPEEFYQWQNWQIIKSLN